MQTIKSIKNGRKRKFLLVLPLLTLPFLTAMFWALGGGEGATGASPASGGLNPELPVSKTEKEMNKNKLSFYEQADEDSARLWQEIMNDPYYRKASDSVSGSFRYAPYPPSRASVPLNGSALSVSYGNTESKIYDRLSELETVVGAPQVKVSSKEMVSRTPVDLSADLFQLESLMREMNEKGRDEGELRELNAMLDKVLDVQHPGRVKSRIQGNGATTTGTRLPMRLTAGEPKTYFGWSKDTGRKSGNAFFSESFSAPVHTVANAVGAEVYQSQVVTDGATVKLRLLAPCYIGNIELPKGSFVHAVARFSQDRLQLHVPSVRYQSSVLLLSMDAYDLDGLEGIFASGTGGQAMAKSRVGQQLEAVELGSYDASLKSQAATASLQTAKALLFKKNKPVQITLRAGYQILLKDKAQQ